MTESAHMHVHTHTYTSFLLYLDYSLKKSHGWHFACSAHLDFLYVFLYAEEIIVPKQWLKDWFTDMGVSNEVIKQDFWIHRSEATEKPMDWLAYWNKQDNWQRICWSNIIEMFTQENLRQFPKGVYRPLNYWWWKPQLLLMCLCRTFYSLR